MENKKKATQVQPKQGGRGRMPQVQQQQRTQPPGDGQQQREVGPKQKQQGSLEQWKPQSSLVEQTKQQKQDPAVQRRPQSSQGEETRQQQQIPAAQQRPQSSQGQKQTSTRQLQQEPFAQQRPQYSQEQKQEPGVQWRPESSPGQQQAPAVQRRPQSCQGQQQEPTIQPNQQYSEEQQHKPQSSQGQQQEPLMQRRPQSSPGQQQEPVMQRRPQSSQGQQQEPVMQRKPQSSQGQQAPAAQWRPQSSQGQQQEPVMQRRPQSSQGQQAHAAQRRPQSSQGPQQEPVMQRRPQSSQGLTQVLPQEGPNLKSPTLQQTSPALSISREVLSTSVTSRSPQQSSPSLTGKGDSTRSSGFQIPVRKDCPPSQKRGGKTIVVETNHLALSMKNTKAVIFHYDVSVVPERPFRFYRPALNAVQKKCYPGRHPAFDGKKNLYAFPELPITQKELVETVHIFDEEREAEREITVTIKFAASVDMSVIKDYLRCGSSLSAPQDAIQALDIVLRQPAANRCVTIGRSFFTKPPGRVISLGDGLDLWYGFFQSAIIGWKPYLNIDVAHKGFPSPVSCLQILAEICQCNLSKLEQTNFSLQQYQTEKFREHINSLKVIQEIPNHRLRRSYKVIGLSECPRRNKFSAEDKNTGEKKSLSVEEYFLEKYKLRLRFPHLPCLKAGSREKPVSLPIELCRIMEGQVVMKSLNELQTRNMVKEAAVDTESRKRKIVDSMRKIGFNQDPCIQEFGLAVSDNFTKVEAHILTAPTVDYKDRSNRSIIPARVDRGVWRINDSKFLSAAEISRWCILSANRRVSEDELRNLAEGLTKYGREAGLNILEAPQIACLEQPAKIEDYFRKSQQNKVKLIVVVLPDRGVSYATIKKMAELQVGVLTQCLKTNTVQRKCNQSTLVNILLKINAKLNGVNHYITPEFWPDIFQRPIMVVGADVTHPSPDQSYLPSIAAVAASHDPRAFKYNMIWRLQPPRVEVIGDLRNIMVEQLKFFYRSTQQKPERILFYRDGVSEGQFRVVLDVELRAIRAACHSLSSEYQPAITFFVVQKRHHTRFFPSAKDADGKNKNVPAGTVVDTEITHPTEVDFFLVSHASIQGTARPTKYHLLWDDSNMSEQVLEEITYYLCHLFARCTRSVSYPAPTYYAHLAAFRARSYIEMEGNQCLNLDNLGQEQGRRTIKDNIVRNNPMFFV